MATPHARSTPHQHSLARDHENFTAYTLHNLRERKNFRDYGAASPYLQARSP
jgi:hypothetical protein